MASILVVDDEAHVTRVLRLALERAGHVVESACDGEEALKLLSDRRFDALVTDLTMPRMTGRELCERVCGELGNHELPIFVLTSRAEDEFRIWAAGLEKTQFVEKPLSLRRLVSSIDAALAPSGAAEGDEDG